ncbi:hypothetical protein GCM10010441_40010 [Kitasatospora paracochleata]|uniref:Uncharacterized protein n=1 Tax=Kitasatospora paracochleata TaxID=58354 RepID=A0ABT1IVW5_9ACTN|nr:hypothetical protein [Kitasatospora paracochleata]
MRAPIEAKVKAASFAAGPLTALLNDVQTDNTLLNPLPTWTQAIAIPLIPPALTFLAGYRRPPHPPRRPRRPRRRRHRGPLMNRCADHPAAPDRSAQHPHRPRRGGEQNVGQRPDGG